jgi:hypothetical protein
VSDLEGFDFILGVGSATTREFTDEELEEIAKRPKNPIGFAPPEHAPNCGRRDPHEAPYECAVD